MGEIFSPPTSPLCSSSGRYPLPGPGSEPGSLQALLRLRLVVPTPATAIREVISLQPAGFEYGNDL